MSGSLAGAFDPERHTAAARLSSALAPARTELLDEGPLQVAHTDAAVAAQGTVCVLAGVIDNASDLRRELAAPERMSIEQLLIAGWRRWRAALPARLRGDFVLLIWERDRAEGLIARDQLGVRCLYLHGDARKLCFATEIPQLLRLLERRPAPDPVTLAHWLSMSSRPGAFTLYDGVRRLNPGCALLLGRDGAIERPYWAPRFHEPAVRTHGQAVEELRRELDRAVARRTDRDGATGVMMSAGLDSSAVAAFAERAPQASVRACSAVFPEHPAVDESTLIAELTERLGLSGVCAEVRPGGLLDSALAATVAWQLPLRSWGDFWALPLLRALAADGVRVVLGGDGGDELFGVRAHLLADLLRAGRPGRAARLLGELPGAAQRPGAKARARMFLALAVAGALPYGVHRPLRDLTTRARLPSWLMPGAAGDVVASGDPLAWKRLAGPRWWADAAHSLTRGIEELGLFEHHRQRATSAGVQVRHPMFDLDLLEHVLREPALSSFDPRQNRPMLRAAVAGLVPDGVAQRPGKALFDSIVIDSLSGPDLVTIRRLLAGPDTELAPYVRLERVRRDLLDDDRLRRERPFEWMCQVWRLTTAECWLRVQADPDRPILPSGFRASPARVRVRALRAPVSSSVFPS